LFFNKKTDNGNIFSTKEIAASKLLFSAERQGTINFYFPYSLSASYHKPLLL